MAKLADNEVSRKWEVFHFSIAAILIGSFYFSLTSWFTKSCTLLYACWYIYDRNTSSQGGRRTEWFRRLKFIKSFSQLFPFSLEKTADLDPRRKYIFGYHPHGGGGLGAVVNFATEATDFSALFPGLKCHLLSHQLLHHLPLHREFLALFGICDVSKPSIDYVLQESGSVAVIVVGGAREALMTDPVVPYIVLKNRKGFVKMALKHGAHLVPCYSFGENQILNVHFRVYPHTRLNGFQKLYKRLIGYPPLCVVGAGMLGLPKFIPVHTIVGKPVPLEQDLSPSQEKVDQVHEIYMQELAKLFNEHKQRFGCEKQSLVFVDD